MSINGEDKQEVTAKGDVSILRFYMNELSGALGDIGTFLPHIIGAITLAQLNPSGVLTMFGLFYVTTGLFYRIPMAVQPMKAASAAVLIQKATPGEIAGAGLVLGALLTILATTGFMEKLAKITPSSVVGGIRLGLGLSLAFLGLKMIIPDPVLGVLMLVIMLPFNFSRTWPTAIFAVAIGIGYSFLIGKLTGFPDIKLGFYLPPMVIPTVDELRIGIFKIVIPQIPLTIANAIIVTSVMAHKLFPHATRVNVRNLALTQGLGNLLAAPFGGYLMCHGGGGLVAHYRFGARTAIATMLLGVSLLFVGLFLGPEAVKLFQLVPEAVLGALLVYGGLDLARGMDYSKQKGDLFVVLSVALLSIWVNPSWGFILGLPLAYAFKKIRLS